MTDEQKPWAWLDHFEEWSNNLREMHEPFPLHPGSNLIRQSCGKTLHLIAALRLAKQTLEFYSEHEWSGHVSVMSADGLVSRETATRFPGYQKARETLDKLAKGEFE